MRTKRKGLRSEKYKGYWRGKPAQNGFWYPGRLLAETTCDLFKNRFRVKDCNMDYIIGKQYQEYIKQSTHSNRWKVLAYKWLIKLYEANNFTDFTPCLQKEIRRLK